MADFVPYINSAYEMNWHHKLLCTYLDAFIRGDIRRLMVFMPPQHGKSELVSRNLPAKLLGQFPDRRIILTSYSASMASSFNRSVQRIIDTPEYRDIYPGTRLMSPELHVNGNYTRNTELFEVVGHRGAMLTVGVGGSITGNPADYLFIDDPVKDQEEASSPTIQQKNWEWYTDVFLTRAHNDTQILITQTRWNVDDLSGKILALAESSDDPLHQFTVLCLPAIRVDYDDPLDPRELGGALWPSRHTKERIEAIKTQSLRTWMSLYQQDPKPTQAGGEMYPSFDAAKHSRAVKYDPEQPLYLFWDENVVPYLPVGIFQRSDNKLIMIDEIAGRHPNNTLDWVCKMIAKRYHGHTAGMFIGGDATANKEDVKLEKGYNFYRLITAHLQEFKPTLIVPSANPAVYLRTMWIDEVFRTGIGGVELVIGENCPLTIADLQYTKQAPDKTKAKEEATDPVTRKKYQKRGHFSDIVDYSMTTSFADAWAGYRKGGVNILPTVGKNASKNSY